jgi:hypothetical protein
MKPTVQEVSQELAEGLADAGKIIEGGFAGFRMMVIPSEAPPIQVNEMRMAFFAGAQHLFASIMAVMDTDREPTPRDLHRMSMIHEELEAFRKDFELNHLPTDGSA